jgi:hypothetical protein
MIKLGGDTWLKLDEPIVVEAAGWWATWHGGEYIDVFAAEEGARLDAAGENTGDFPSVSVINTTGDEVDEDDPEQYVKDELRAWARREGADTRANM